MIDTTQFTGHTPGPWTADYTCVTTASYSPIADCEVRRGVMPDGGTHDLDREIQANARLIAAAPDLLEENKRLREALEKIANIPLSMSWKHHFYEAVEMAQSALQEKKDA